MTGFYLPTDKMIKRNTSHILSVEGDRLWRLRESHVRFPKSINYVSLPTVPAFPTKCHFNYDHRELQGKNKEGLVLVLGFVLPHQFPDYSTTAAAEALACRFPFICGVVLWKGHKVWTCTHMAANLALTLTSCKTLGKLLNLCIRYHLTPCEVS